jgi:integrase
MDTERTQATVNPEAWAAAQVEAVAREVAAKAKPKRKRQEASARGVYFQWRAGGTVRGPEHVCTERSCTTACKLNGETMGEWFALWYDLTGERHREKAGTRAAAVALYQRRQTEKRQGKHFPESMHRRDYHLKDLVAHYLEAAKASQAKTVAVIERRLTIVVGIVGNVEAKTIKAEDLERLKIKLATGARTEHRKPATINRFLQDLKAVFCRAVDGEKLDRNPFNGVDLLTENNKRSRDLTPDEELRLFEKIPPTPPALRPYFRFLLATGARAGEACALTWPAISEVDGVAELPETKAGEKQYLTLSKAALAILAALPKNGPHVFCWPDGRPFTVDFATHAFHKAVVRLEIPDLRQHDLRHAFAIRRLRGGANLVAVSGLLRHASTRMSERYLHVTRTDLRAAVEAGQPSTAERSRVEDDISRILKR